MNLEKPNIKYVYVVGSEPELNDYKLTTEMYIMNYRNTYSSIFPDNKGYSVLKNKLKVLDSNIGNAYTITESELATKPTLHLQTLNKELKLDSFKENVDTIKEYLIDNNLMSRINNKGELNFFKVIGFIKDGAYYILANYHYGTEQDVNNNIIKQGDDFENVSFICYSVALDFYPRLNNVTSVREKTALKHNNLALMTSKKFYSEVTQTGQLETSIANNNVTLKVNGVNYSLHHAYLLNDNLKRNDPKSFITTSNYLENSVSYKSSSMVKEPYHYLGFIPFDSKMTTPVINYYTNDNFSVSVVSGKDKFFNTNVTLIANNYTNFWDNSTTNENYNSVNAVGYNGYKTFYVGLNTQGNVGYGRVIYHNNGKNTGSNEYINNTISNVAFEKYLKIPTLATINNFNDSLFNTITLGYGNTPTGTKLIQTHSISFKFIG